jgi:glyoxylase-like metal-dependent hydrolase (beta-lactamase superfamily II)
MHLERVSCRVPTRAPTGQTHAYVLGSEDALLGSEAAGSKGEGTLLVDPAARTDDLDALVDRVGHVALTHHHPDHVGAVADYAEATGATVWCRIGRGADFEAATAVDHDRTFAAGTEISTGGGAVEVVDTPGHAPEHVAFGFPSPDGEEYLVGDLAVAEGSVVVSHPSGDVRAYVSSLRRLWARDPARLHPAHGPTIEDPRETCRRLIDHRRDREERVLRAVVDGAETLPEITDAAYEKDLSRVRDLAEATVRAHVEKLRVEGRISWENGRARAVLP